MQRDIAQKRKPTLMAVKTNKAAKTVLPAKSSEKCKVDMEKLNDMIRQALRKGYGKPCPVLGVLGYRFTMPSKKYGWPFYRVLAETPDGLVAVFVSGFSVGEMKTSINTVSKTSYTVKKLLAQIARRTKRAADKLAGKEAK